jgi:surface polysaccharide O-acyltransferase-like enzyme
MVSIHPTADVDERRLGRAAADARRRDGVMDTMRGLAIVMVVAIHSLPKLPDSAVVTAVDSLLRPCVPLFLFASGYLTARAGRVPLARRMGRVLGPYTIAFLAAYTFMAVQNPAMDHRPLVAAARYVFAYVFVYYYVFVYVGCTLLLRLAFMLADPSSHGGRVRLLLALAGAIVVGLLFGAYLDPLLQRFAVPPGMIEEARMRDLPFWFAFVALGCIVGETDVQRALRAARFVLAAATAAAYVAYAGIRIAGIGDAAAYDSIAFFLYASLFCLVVLGFAPERPALAMLGAASYFIYLWHIFPIMMLRAVPALQRHASVSFAVEFTVALAASVLLAGGLRRAGVPRLAQWLGA